MFERLSGLESKNGKMRNVSKRNEPRRSNARQEMPTLRPKNAPKSYRWTKLTPYETLVNENTALRYEVMDLKQEIADLKEQLRTKDNQIAEMKQLLTP